jgi:osmotically-inducible protein OsmY
MSWFNGRILVMALSVQLAGCVCIQFNPQERNFLAAVDDLNIKTEFNARLIGESGALFASVNSTVIEGRLHITGTVPAQADRQKVTRIAWTIPAVKEVVNDIEVTAETGLVEAARDRWITARLRALMIGDTAIRDSNYAIDTENGIIYLNGIAQNREELERVMDYAKSVSEARQVVSYVIMKDDPRRASNRQDRLASQDRAE